MIVEIEEGSVARLLELTLDRKFKCDENKTKKKKRIQLCATIVRGTFYFFFFFFFIFFFIIATLQPTIVIIHLA